MPQLVKGTPYLTFFIASNNQILSVEAKTFRYCSQLKWLDISRNMIHQLEKESFYGLESLEFLNISHNVLKLASPRLFVPLTSIKVILLHNNHLASLDMFSEMTHLFISHLDLSHNKIVLTYRDVIVLQALHLRTLNADFNEAWWCAIQGTNISAAVTISHQQFSCGSLIEGEVWHKVCISLCLTILILNFLSGTWRLLCNEFTILNSTLTLLSVLNAFCSIHLLGLLVVDQLYGEYIFIDLPNIQSNIWCLTSFLLTHFESELPVTIAAVLSWTKYKGVSSVEKPQEKVFSLEILVITITGGWILISFMLHILDIIPIYETSDACYAPLYSSSTLAWFGFGNFQLFVKKPLILSFLIITSVATFR